LALRKLGEEDGCERLLQRLLARSREMSRKPAGIDYFATSLPTMLLFHDDLEARNNISAAFLEAQARLGLGDKKRARPLLRRVLKLDPSHATAMDLREELLSELPISLEARV
jgi:hypothetical protein